MTVHRVVLLTRELEIKHLCGGILENWVSAIELHPRQRLHRYLRQLLTVVHAAVTHHHIEELLNLFGGICRVHRLLVCAARAVGLPLIILYLGFEIAATLVLRERPIGEGNLAEKATIVKVNARRIQLIEIATNTKLRRGTLESTRDSALERRSLFRELCPIRFDDSLAVELTRQGSDNALSARLKAVFPALYTEDLIETVLDATSRYISEHRTALTVFERTSYTPLNFLARKRSAEQFSYIFFCHFVLPPSS